MEHRGNWATKFGFVLAAVGSAVGLGNMWKFPYITGVYGGGAFVLVYLVCILIVGVPIMVAELMIGKRTQRNPVGAFQELAGKKSSWKYVGWLGVISGFLILSFYSVVAGWSMAYIFKAIAGFSGSVSDIKSQFTSLKTNPGMSILWHTIFMGLTIGIVSGGIKRGIERWSKILMPTLIVILLGLTFHGLFFTDGGIKALAFLFKPDFSKLSADGILSALGHCFFTLSLGMGAMITYGSYLKKRVNILRSALTICFLDTFIALLAGTAIFSVVFQYKMKAGEGLGLIFETLPVLFAKTGSFISIPFFLLLTFAALTSSISLLEVVVSYFIDERGWRRKKATLIIGGSIYLLGILAAIDQLRIMFKGVFRNFFYIFDFTTTNYMLPVGGLLITIFVAWGIKEEIRKSSFQSASIYYLLWRFILRFVTPVAVTIILLQGLNII